MNRLLATLITGALLVSAADARHPGFADSSDEIVRGLTAVQPAAPVPGVSKSLDLFGYQPARPKAVFLREGNKGLVLERERVVVNRGPGIVNLKVEFDFDSALLRPGARHILDEFALALDSPRLQRHAVWINGHTDGDGSADYNLRLSLDRARSVRRYLVSRHGIDETRLPVAGYGESAPIAPNISPEYRQLNRRVELRLAR